MVEVEVEVVTGSDSKHKDDGKNGARWPFSVLEAGGGDQVMARVRTQNDIIQQVE